MPISGADCTPSAADALGTSYTGRVVSDSVVVIAYDSHIATARHVPYEVQNEILRLIQITSTGGGALEAVNVIGTTLPAGPIAISGSSSVDGSTPIFSVGYASASDGRPADSLLLLALAAGASGSARSGGTFTSTLDTTGSYVGAPVYLGLNGELVLIEPTFEDGALISQIVGNVQTLATNGVISGLLRPAKWLQELVEEDVAYVA